jgi:UDPglucose 6-dehydrogenase
MKVCVAGLWHLGSVTAACLGSSGHDVTAFDPDSAVVTDLAAGKPPLFEPGLKEQLHTSLASGKLRPLTDAAEAVKGAEVLWITYDTPVDDEDVADVDYVLDRVRELLPLLGEGAVVLISSQLPVGSTARLAADAPAGITFAYSPENLRLGKAIDAFANPDRIVVGVGDDDTRAVLKQLFDAITDQIEWMSIESAEMSKHAINAFLATSVAFINELATLCESVGADASQVEHALKSEARIGPRAYLHPGAAFAGGTLARDVRALTAVGGAAGVDTPLLQGIWDSNNAHRGWPKHALEALLGPLSGKKITVFGLTYKAGTDTLRRSSSVELCLDLTASGATVRAHDPAVKALPDDLAKIEFVADPFDAATGADALVVATEWPDYRGLDAGKLVAALAGDVVVDANGFLSAAFAADARVRYATVGRRPA